MSKDNMKFRNIMDQVPDIKSFTVLGSILLVGCSDNSGTACTQPQVVVEKELAEYARTTKTRKTLSFDERGNILSEEVTTSRKVYDVVSGDQKNTTRTFDSIGRILTEKVMTGISGNSLTISNTTNWSYDEQGYLRSVITVSPNYQGESNGTQKYFTYDQNGNELTEELTKIPFIFFFIDSGTTTRNSIYDDRNNRISMTYEVRIRDAGTLFEHGSIVSTFDSSDNEMSRQVVEWKAAFDMAPQTEKVTQFTWEYDSEGKKISGIESVQYGSGNENKYTRDWSYDDSGRLKKQIMDVDFASDGVIDRSIDTQWIYDNRGNKISRITKWSITNGLSDQKLNSFYWTYDETDKLVATTYKSGQVVKEKRYWTYDSQGRTLSSRTERTPDGFPAESDVYSYNSCFVDSGLKLESPSVEAPPIYKN